MFKKILVPLDGSDLAAKILPQVEELAKHTNAQVTLLSVGSSNICPIGKTAAKGAGEAAPCPETPLADHLEQITGKLRAAGIEANWVYKEGQSGSRDRGVCPGEPDGSHRHSLPWSRRGCLVAGERDQTGHRSRHGAGVVAAGGGSRASHPQKRDVLFHADAVMRQI